MDNDITSLKQKAYDLAFSYEAERGSCPQAVLSAIMETLNIGDPKTIQAADGLAGGTALSSEGTCGALVGGILAIGTVVGRSYKDFSEGKRNNDYQFCMYSVLGDGGRIRFDQHTVSNR